MHDIVINTLDNIKKTINVVLYSQDFNNKSGLMLLNRFLKAVLLDSTK